MAEENIQPVEETKVAPEVEAPVKDGKTAKGKVSKRKKKKAIRQVLVGRAYIQASYNNTIVTFTDQGGNVLAASSAGRVGFKGPKKSTPYAASMIVQDAAEKVKRNGLRDVNVYINGVGSGRESAVRALNANGFNVMQINDITPIPHNGCRPKKPRRI
ncbi:MAG: 30S ribosomal protein S11 [bacterium]